ncbi:hypothetical protein K458DRAFT_328367 [Lentithecium fluviatile CBS 122367]|uniref:Uncharacterized protein n=1 Tax=Lentithecium fluviatile CBS 122367 TaxID=1168545 RepID=A0A6G1JHW7_9PLEO|nr:hypothetical protein K458DRAFT_328367 [Lentithecium fluviatile CBS 122367]
MVNSDSTPRRSRLAESAYNSPYSRAGAPTPHPNFDPYMPLRAESLATFESMGYDPQTMVEHGIVWADQDPYAHGHHTQYMHFMRSCFYRGMESYEEFLSEEEYDGMALGKTVAPLIRRYQLDIRRQVRYPDTVSEIRTKGPCSTALILDKLIADYREGSIEPTRNSGTTPLFSLKQQAVAAEIQGSTTFTDVKNGRPIDIRTLGGGWPKVFEAFTKKAEHARTLKEK